MLQHKFERLQHTSLPVLRLLQVTLHYDLILGTLNYEGVLHHLDGFRAARLGRAGGLHLILINDFGDDHHGYELIVEVKMSQSQVRCAHQESAEGHFKDMSVW